MYNHFEHLQKQYSKQLRETINFQLRKYKNQKFLQFINLKISLQSIKHRKIAQKIFLKYSKLDTSINLSKTIGHYLPKNVEFLFDKLNENTLPLTKLTLNLKDTSLGKNKLSSPMKELSYGLKGLNNIRYCDLNLGENILGKNQMNMQYLAEGFRGFSKKLIYMKLSLNENRLNSNQENMKQLGKALEKLTKLKCLSLSLQSCELGGKLEDLKYLFQALKKLSHLNKLELDLKDNKRLGQNMQNMDIIVRGIQEIKGLNDLTLDLSACNLGIKSQNFQFLGQEIEKNENTIKILSEGLAEAKQLKNLNLQLRNNNLGNDLDNIRFLGNGIKNMGFLQSLALDLENNEFPENFDANILIQGMQSQKRLKLSFYENEIFESREILELLSLQLQNLKNLKQVRLCLGNQGQDPVEDLRFLIQCFMGERELNFIDELELEVQYYYWNQKEGFFKLIEIVIDLQQCYQGQNYHNQYLEKVKQMMLNKNEEDENNNNLNNNI